MALENLTGPDVFITNLVQANPTVTDPVSQGDDHLRGIKNVLLNSFPNINAPLTVSSADINGFAPLASPAFTGVPTAPTAAAGTDTDQVATTAFVKANQSGLGVSQTWQNVLASRSIGATYTNSTPSPISVAISAQATSGSSGTAVTVFLTVGGVEVGRSKCNESNGSALQQTQQQLFAVVPAGATYSLTQSGNATLLVWAELRGA